MDKALTQAINLSVIQKIEALENEEIQQNILQTFFDDELENTVSCSSCKQKGKSLRYCSGCKVVKYCDAICQRTDWNAKHCFFCRVWATKMESRK